MRPIDADVLCEGRVSNDPVVIAAKCEPTLDYAPKQQWISVEDRLPDTRHTMLVCTRNHNNVPKVAMAYYENGFGWCGSGGRWGNVTHWMPLPEPPKEE